MHVFQGARAVQRPTFGWRRSAPILGAALVVALVSGQAGGAVGGHALPGSAGGHVPLGSRATSAEAGDLSAIASVGQQGVIVVGDEGSGSAERPTVLRLRRDGWVEQEAENPNVAAGFSGVAVAGPKAIFAVGWTYEDVTRPLIERWNGRAWRIQQVPAADGASLFAVDALTRDDVWAVGPGPTGGVTMHFDGSRWVTIANPSPPSTTLTWVEMIAADDVWALGRHHSGTYKNFAMHFDGVSWTIADTPNEGAALNVLAEADALSSSDIWAVGYANDSGLVDGMRPSITHFDGENWTTVASPPVAGGALWGVHAVAPDDVWAVGESAIGTLVMHYDGETWQVDRTAKRTTIQRASLYGVAAPPDGGLIAVGSQVAASDPAARGARYLRVLYDNIVGTWEPRSCC